MNPKATRPKGCQGVRLAVFRLIVLKTLFLLPMGLADAQPDKEGDGNFEPGRSMPNLVHRVSVKPLDLSRAPTTDELMAAGQLGGILFPTHELPDKGREESARLDFGKAIEQWNKHEYPKAIQLFKKHLEKFPDSPWGAEAILHIGCDATYNGRYPEAEAIFTQMIAKNQFTNHPGAQMMLAKARQRLALVKVEQNNLEAATQLFLELKNESPDWKLRTYAIHWLQRLSTYSAARQALLNCGADALGYVLERDGNSATAKAVRQRLPQTMRGHSIQALTDLAAEHGYQASARRLATNDLNDLAKLPLPAVLHIREGFSGDKGHYWVLDKIQGNQLELFDPQSRRRFHQTLAELVTQWSGNALVFSKSVELPGRSLNPAEMEDALGGCCGAPTAPSNLGEPGRNGTPGSSAGPGSPGGGPPGDSDCGAPAWSVNMINLNLFVRDTPMWYEPPIGPPVRISVSYNAQSSIVHHQPFGNKWTFSYGGYLIMDTSGTIAILMPDGRIDVYNPNGAGGYTRPYQVHNTLTQIAPNHFELRSPDDTVYVYQVPPGTASQQPFLTEIRDAYGQKLTFGYDSSVNLTSITDAQGKGFALNYTASGLVTNISDPFGRNASFQYDGNQNLVRITDMGGYSSTLTYDANVFVTSIGDARGTTTFYTEVPGNAGNNSDNYPPPGDPNMFQNYRITVTDALGAKEEFMWYAGCDIDGYGCAGYAWYVSPRDYIPWQSQTVNNYRSRAPKTRFIPTRVASGLHGEIARVVTPEGGVVQYGYDSVTGDRTSVTDSHGHAWQYRYNSLGLATSVTDPKGTPTTFTYTANNVDLLAISNGLGIVSLTYDTYHNPLTITDRLSNITRFSYDSFGHLTSQVDVLGITNSYIYDGNQRLIQVNRAGFSLASLGYDSVGRLVTSTDATGLTLTNAFDNLNHTLSVAYPDGKSNSFVYSTCCPRLIDRMTDRSGRTVTFNYDALKRLTQSINPQGGVLQAVYDANGNRTRLIDSSGNVTTFAYDLDNRLTNQAYADGKSFSLRYDPSGLLTNRVNARGIATRYTYDTNHNLLTLSYTDGTPPVINTFDSFNRLVSVTDGVGTQVYSYDANSRLTTFDGPWDSDTITNLYDPLGRVTNLLVQSSQPTSYIYDALNRLTGVRVGPSAYAYSYNGANPLVQRLDRPNGGFSTYQYDSLERLTDIANKQSAGQIVNEFSYTYNGQDLCDSETFSNGVASASLTNQLITYTYNQVNQALTVSSQGQALVLVHDADGNLTQGYTDAGIKFVAQYDAENRLRSFVYTNAGAVVCSNRYFYGWNGFVGRITEYQNGVLNNETRFVRTGYLPLQERGATGDVTRKYSWGIGVGGGIGSLLELAQSGQTYSYLYDGHGNVSAVIDSAQVLASAYAYEPFGMLAATTGSLDQPYRFSTKPLDPKTGLIDFGYRLYLPSIGRWLNRDPLGEAGGVNLYGYALNDPLNYFDAYGLSWKRFNRRLRNFGLGFYSGMAGGAAVGAVFAGVGAIPGAIGGSIAGGVSGLLADPCDSAGSVIGHGALSGGVGSVGAAVSEFVSGLPRVISFTFTAINKTRGAGPILRYLGGKAGELLSAAAGDLVENILESPGNVDLRQFTLGQVLGTLTGAIPESEGPLGILQEIGTDAANESLTDKVFPEDPGEK